jgi:hypothetical protein
MKPVSLKHSAAFLRVAVIAESRSSLDKSCPLDSTVHTFLSTISNLFPFNCLKEEVYWNKITKVRYTVCLDSTHTHMQHSFTKFSKMMIYHTPSLTHSITHPKRISLSTYEKCPTRIIAMPPCFEFPPPCGREVF